MPGIGARGWRGGFASARQRAGVLLFVVNLALPVATLRSEPPAKTGGGPSSSDARKARDQAVVRARLIESANGWVYVKGEWVHPDGYKFANNKVIRTTAKTGRAFPNPPGKLALQNATALMPQTNPARSSVADDAGTSAEKAAEMRRKNLTPTAAPQTGTHL
jgi:hypothetical protein